MPKNNIQSRKQTQGLTLVELMVATVILTTVALSLAGALGNFGKVITTSRETTLATHLAQEKLDSIRSLTFYQVMVTSTTFLDNNFSPALEYDNGYYPPESIQSGGTRYIRKVFVEKADTPSGTIENVGYPHPDTGLKRIHVYIIWQRQDGGWKRVEVSGLSYNPDRATLDKRVYGTITDSLTGLPVAGVLVQARRNPGWGDISDSNGQYSFYTTDASMKLITEKYSYKDYTSSEFAISYGDNQYDFSIIPISSRTISGYVIRYSDVLISQINAKWDSTSSREFVELYNGSPSDIDLTGYTLSYVDSANTEINIPWAMTTTIIPSHAYFLALGSPGAVDTIAPNGKSANAQFDLIINETTSGGIILRNAFGTAVDMVAWGNSSNSPPSLAVEDTGFDFGVGGPGISEGLTLTRKAVSTSTLTDVSPGGIHINGGNAWDTQVNNSDFVVTSTANARNTSTITNPMGGTGLSGAVLTGYDDLSLSTSAISTGFFSMLIATGNWVVSAATTSGMGQKTINVPGSGGTTFHNILATSPCTVGFLIGRTLQYGSNPFAGVLVEADPGNFNTFSTGGGKFTITVPADEEYYVTANPNFYDADWNTATTPDAFYVSGGEIVDVGDLNIWKNGFISGRVTTNGVDGLPGVVIVAAGQYSNGNTAMTDAGGNYSISGLRLVGNPYTLTPALSEGQSTTPTQYGSVDVVQGSTISGYDFVISGGFVTISGTVTINGLPIETGVNIIASTTSISTSNPPDINFVVRNSVVKYYQSISDTQGLFSIPVIGGETYNLVAWYTNESTTTAKTLVVTVPSSSGYSSANITWP